MRRLIVCLDGTWNLKVHTTNIWRIYTLLSEYGAGDIRQLKHYVQGVGTRWYDSFTGGAFGAGVYANVKDAYTWIVETYRPHDEIFLFGFSRGALTALSLANLIDRCGIVKPESLNTFEEVYRLYQMPGFARNTPASKRFRGNSADLDCNATLRFLGLFDTVASLYASRFFKESMHVLALPDSARDVFHAIAIDENRRPFQSVAFPAAPANGRLHERWFSGAHANVGGGYPFDPLAFVPLYWMLQSARQEAGLEFNHSRQVVTTEEGLYTRERDSFAEFALGAPAMLPFLFRKRRLIGRQASGDAQEFIDSSVVARYLKFRSYQKSSVALSHYLKNRKSDTLHEEQIDVSNEGSQAVLTGT